MSDYENEFGADSRSVPPDGFKNEPLTNFSLRKNREVMTWALDTVRARKGLLCSPLINGKPRFVSEIGKSVNPADHNHVLAHVGQCGRGIAEEAMLAAQNTFPAWNDKPVGDRAQILRRAAQVMRYRRFELAAWEIYEVSKTWREADADIAEAIDFLEYYSGMAERLMRYGHTQKMAGESNEYGYEGRGVSVVIAPWNFPIAIATGMCAATLAAGNTVVFKPARAAQICGYFLSEIFDVAGVPAGVFNFVPGTGEELGELLVKHRFTKNILFTGSKEVGFRIRKMAAEADLEQQTHCRNVIAEMGGKNAVIVDASADLDQAVGGVAQSAFGFQGQKCSACSRVIVMDDIYDDFLRRLIGIAATLRRGDPADPTTHLGAVIDEAAWRRINSYIALGRQEARLIYSRSCDEEPARNGWFVPHAIFADVPPDSRLAQEEIFGPVLSVIRAKDFKEAIVIANNSIYRLTAGVYSRTEEHIALARSSFRVGNLYINRGITGAIVGRQPFGGSGASGTGPKAGGPDYLRPLMRERTITENLVRRGFSPQLKN